MLRFEAAKRIKEINARLLLDSKALVRKRLLLGKDITALEVSSIESELIASLSVYASEMKSELVKQSDAVMFFSVSKAHLDASMSVPDDATQSVSIESVSSALFSIMATQTSHFIRVTKEHLSERHRQLTTRTNSKGARAIAINNAMESLESVLHRDSLGRRINPSLAFELTALKFFSDLEHKTYVAAANGIGINSFVISQKGHRRDGIKFTAGSYPTKELHPRSMATIKIGDENVYST